MRLEKMAYRKRMNTGEVTVCKGSIYKDFAFEKMLGKYNITHTRTGAMVDYGSCKTLKECVSFIESENFKKRFNDVVDKMEEKYLFDDYKEL